ncbi:DUF4395 domain-containing protein [Bacillus timonensis]|nr:DUF4395 domain-containing protein [Bacillus timonensis]
MNEKVRSIPRPLVRLNQWFIFLSVIATWVTGQYLILTLPLVAGICGILFGFNPIMRIGKLFLRKHPSAYIPEDVDQQQFNQIIAITMLSLGIIGYAFDWTIVALTATGMVALASFVAILGFCVGCYIRFQWQQYKFRHSQRLPN